MEKEKPGEFDYFTKDRNSATKLIFSVKESNIYLDSLKIEETGFRFK